MRRCRRQFPVGDTGRRFQFPEQLVAVLSYLSPQQHVFSSDTHQVLFQGQVLKVCLFVIFTSVPVT